MPSASPSTEPRPAPPSKLPRGLLGMLALVAAAEWGIMRHDHDLSTLIASNWRIEGGAPARHAAKSQVLCFGDSMVKFGVQPRILGGKLGMPAYNFALYCGSAPASYFMLRRSFDAGATPRAVVVDFQPELLMGDSMKILNRVYPELLTLRETAELCWKARNPDRFAEFVVAKLLPSARKRFEVRAGLAASIKGESASVREKVLASKRNWKVNRGAEVLAKNPYYQGEVPDTGAYPAMFWTPWKADRLNDIYVRRFLRLAEARGVPVFWLLQPNAAAVDARREAVGYNAQYEKFVRGYQARFPNLRVVDGRHVNYPHQVFTDPVHLDRHGAVAYSLGVAEVLKSHFDRPGSDPRWVALPDHREEIGSVILEDTIESSLALKAGREAAVRR